MARKSENRITLSNARVARLKPRMKDGVPVDGFTYDTDVPGLAVRVRINGEKAFYLRYLDGKRQRWVKLQIQPPAGTVDQARKEARLLLGRKSMGDDPAKDRDDRRKAGNVKALCDRYLKAAEMGNDGMKKKLKEKTLREYSWQMERYIIPALGSRAVVEVDEADLEKIHEKVADRPVLSNRLHALLHRMFKKAIDWKWRKDNPAAGHEKKDEDPRKRWLSAAELEALGEAIATTREDGTIPAQALDAVEALLLTGLRVREVLNMRWSELDFDASTIHLGETKTGPRDASLNQALRALVEARRPAKKEQRLSPWVFSTSGDGSKPISYESFRLHWVRLTGIAGFAEQARIHDLRRSVGTHAVSSLSMTMEVLAGVLGHKDVKSTKIYGLLAANARNKGSDEIGAMMAAHLKGRKKA